MRVLLVDDDSTVRSAVRTVLREAGMVVVEASGGGEVLASTRPPQVDVILCDLYMPGCDGLELLKHLRVHAPSIPVIAMSGGGLIGGVDVLPLASLLGAAATLSKPLNPGALLETIARVAASRGLVPAS